MAFTLWWESEERKATALWIAGMEAGADVPSPDDIWESFNETLAAPPVHMQLSRDELALRRALGVA